MFTEHIVEVVIGAPDDTGRFRTAVDHALNWWNSASAKRHQIVLMPSRGQHRTAADDSIMRTRRLEVSIAATC